MSKRSKRYQKIKQIFTAEKGRVLSMEEAIKQLQANASAKFDEAIEVHIKLNLNRKSGTQVVRGTVQFPKSFGRKRRIAAFVTPEKVEAAKKAGAQIAGGEDLIAKIQKSKKLDFDLAIAEPAMMRHLGQIGKLLGQQGLMPNPKEETVTPKVVEAIQEFLKGKKSFKSDEQGIIHQVIGKVSMTLQDLMANYKALWEAVAKQVPESQKGEFVQGITVCSTMGPGLRIK